MLGTGSYSEPDLSRICDDDHECDECEVNNGLVAAVAVDPGGLLTRQRTWHPGGRGRGVSVAAGAAAAAEAGRLPVIAEVTSFV